MSGAAAAVGEDAWLDGWNAGVCAAAAVLSASDLPADIADHAVDLINQLLAEEGH